MKRIGKILPHVSAALCAVCLVLLAVDLFLPDLSLFLNEGVKALTLIVCLTTALSACLLVARDRRRGKKRG